MKGAKVCFTVKQCSPTVRDFDHRDLNGNICLNIKPKMCTSSGGLLFVTVFSLWVWVWPFSNELMLQFSHQTTSHISETYPKIKLSSHLLAFICVGCLKEVNTRVVVVISSCKHYLQSSKNIRFPTVGSMLIMFLIRLNSPCCDCRWATLHRRGRLKIRVWPDSLQISTDLMTTCDWSFRLYTHLSASPHPAALMLKKFNSSS